MFLKNLAKKFVLNGIVDAGLSVVGMSIKSPQEKKIEEKKETVINNITNKYVTEKHEHNYKVDLSEIVTLLNEENKLIHEKFKKLRSRVVVVFVVWLAIAQFTQAYFFKNYFDNAVKYIVSSSQGYR